MEETDVQKKRRTDRTDPELEARLSAIETQEEHLTNVFNKNYAYNAMAKHLMLNEKPIKWFFL